MKSNAMETDRIPYFAYGSNMCPEQMRERCPGAEPVGPAQLDGFSFLINERGVATIRSAADRTVWGVLWRISPADEAQLDLREGVKQSRYEKKLLNVSGGDGVLHALVYQDQRLRLGSPRPGYMTRVLNGARTFALPQPYIKSLLYWDRAD